MPGGLKRLLAEEVRRSGRSLNDVAVGILASRFAVAFEPSGRAGKPPGEGGSVLLRMPAELKDRLDARSAQRKRNLNDLIIETLSQRLGKEPWPPRTASPRAARTRSASPSSASATARTRSSKASSTTRKRRTTSSSPVSCT